jgi:hypothetical protein
MVAIVDTINMAFRVLDLRNPISIEAKTSGHNRDSFPAWSVVTYQFGATASRPALKMVWYDGGQKPPAELLEGIDLKKPDDKPGGKKKPATGDDGLPNAGKLVIGEKGRLWGYNKLLDGAQPRDVEFPKSPGHFEEWVRAIQGGEPPLSNFPDYAVPLTELVLLGNLAAWCGDKIEWDAEQMRVKNVPGLEALIKPTYRPGYTLDT